MSPNSMSRNSSRTRHSHNDTSTVDYGYGDATPDVRQYYGYDDVPITIEKPKANDDDVSKYGYEDMDISPNRNTDALSMSRPSSCFLKSSWIRKNKQTPVSINCVFHDEKIQKPFSSTYHQQNKYFRLTCCLFTLLLTKSSSSPALLLSSLYSSRFSLE